MNRVQFLSDVQSMFDSGKLIPTQNLMRDVDKNHACAVCAAMVHYTKDIKADVGVIDLVSEVYNLSEKYLIGVMNGFDYKCKLDWDNDYEQGYLDGTGLRHKYFGVENEQSNNY